MATKVNDRYLKYKTADEVQAILESVEHIDSTPTPESNNPISSGGVATTLGDYSTTDEMNQALEGKQNKMTEATEKGIRNIVKNWNPNAQPEPEEEAGSNGDDLLNLTV